MYQQALSFYQHSEFEEALDILKECPKSPQITALYNECIRSLSQRYKIEISDAQQQGNTIRVNTLASKYQKYIGQDEYLLSLIETNNSEEQSDEINENNNTNKYIIIAVFVLVVCILAGFGYYSRSNSNSIGNTESKDTVDVSYVDVVEDEYESFENKKIPDVQSAINNIADFYYLYPQRRNIENYLSQSFKHLRDQYRIEESKQTGLMPGDYIDYDIYTQAQDDIGEPCDIKVISSSNQSLRIKASFNCNSDYVHTLLIDMIPESGEWMIDDIANSEYPNHTIKKTMMEYINQWR